MANQTRDGKSLQHLHGSFLSILPKLVVHAEFAFRYIRCPHDFDDAVAESIGLCWKWFLRLVEQGKDATLFPTVLASYATRAVRSGRRLCRQESPKDALSPAAQQRKHFVVGTLPDVSTLEPNPLQEALIDNTQSPVPEQVAFRIDWPSWNKTQGPGRRKLIKKMLLGHRTNELAQHFRLSPSRISQLRQQLHQSWQEFISEEVSAPRPAPIAA